MTTAKIPGAELRMIVDQIEELEAEKSEIGDRVKNTYSLAKGNGFDVPTIRKAVAHRKKLREDRAKLEEAEALLDLYLAALEQPAQSSTPTATRSNVTALHAGAAA